MTDLAERCILLALGHVGLGEKRQDLWRCLVWTLFNFRGFIRRGGSSRLGDRQRVVAILIKIGNYVRAVLNIRDSGIGHRRSGSECLRIFEPETHVLKSPVAAMTLQSCAVAEAFVVGNFLPDHAVEPRADLIFSTFFEAMAGLTKGNGLFTLGRVGIVQRHDKGRTLVLFSLFLFAGNNFFFGAGHLVTWRLGEVFFIDNVDECPCAKEQKQCQKHRHSDFVQVVVFHVGYPPGRKQRLLQNSSCNAG